MTGVVEKAEVVAENTVVVVEEVVAENIGAVMKVEVAAAAAAVEVFGIADLDFREFGRVGGSKPLAEGRKELDYEGTG